MFILIWSIGVMMVLLQGYAAWCDGFLTQSQLRKRGKNGYSFMEHCGMWVDVFLISPTVSLIVTKYQLPYRSKESYTIFGIALIGAYILGKEYVKYGLKKAEAHTHDGYTTLAGKIHGVYAVIAFWIIGLFYYSKLDIRTAYPDLIVISAVLTLFSFFGTVKIQKNWRYSNTDIFQGLGISAVVWIVTLIKIFT